jgi:hypothetical protein
MEYPKINTLWKRDDDRKGKILEGDLSCPEFGLIKKWYVQEKIDGANVRIVYDGRISFRGRRDDSKLPAPLIDYLTTVFTLEILARLFPATSPRVIFFGEGYGGKIQHGNNYSFTESFCLFDIYMDGRFLEPARVIEIAHCMGLTTPPFLGYLTIEEIVALVTSFPHGFLVNQHPNFKRSYTMEGIIARTTPILRFNENGAPVMFKLKCCDYEKK